MVYEEFLTAVKQQMELALGSGYTLSLRKVQKNNGLVRDGLCITKGTDPVSPSIYLNQYYQQYRKGSSIASLVKELLELYYQNPMPPVDHEAFSSYEKMKHAISFKLIHADSNRELLEDVPYVPWLDLAIVFYLCIHEDENGLMTALIHHSHMKLWGCSLDELKETALANAQLLFPPVISSMACILEEMSRRFSPAFPCREFPSDEAAPFYVLSNTSGINGASCILYKHVLQNFAEEMECDLIILPSSIHEVLLLPDHGDIFYEEMSRLVSYINETEVSAEDQLSNQVYLYSREHQSITLAPIGGSLSQPLFSS